MTGNWKSAALVAILAAPLLAGCASAGAARVNGGPPSPVQEDGFYLRTFGDGGVAVAVGPNFLDDDSWSVGCPIDAMTDRKKCTIEGPTHRAARIMVFYGNSQAPQSICIIGHDFPGRTGQIRVDSNPAVTTDRDGCVAPSQVFGQLKVGSKFTTRSYKWPNDWPVDESANLAGFGKAVEVMRRMNGS